MFLLIRWNQLDLLIILLSIVGIVLEEMKSKLPINPTIIRVMRVLRIARGKHSCGLICALRTIHPPTACRTHPSNFTQLHWLYVVLVVTQLPWLYVAVVVTQLPWLYVVVAVVIVTNVFLSSEICL